MTAVSRIARFALVTADLAATAAFFEDAFDAAMTNRSAGDEALASLFGLPGACIETARVHIGAQTIDLLQFEPPGRSYPVESTSSDLWFQHFAIIVSDMAAAYARLRHAGRFVPISEDGPIVLPPSSGSVSAFKFRDAEGHPLELLQFPAGTGPQVWQDKSPLVLGIDHSAIAVSEAAASIAFFEKAFGLSVTVRTENHGVEQARLDGVAGVRVSVVGLEAVEAPPHLELLAYHVGSRRPIDDATRSNDIAATQIVFETEALDAIVEALIKLRAPFESPGIVELADGSRAIMVLDPDGHRLVVAEPRPS